MVDKHPYVQSGAHLVQTFGQFRKKFPTPVNADTLKKLGIAPNNETYVINVMRFLDLLDEEGKRTDKAKSVFNIHDDKAFAHELSNIVASAYKEVFELHGDAAWELDRDALIGLFRSADDTTDPVAKRQAVTFQILARLAGHGEVPEVTSSSHVVAKPAGKKAVAKKKAIAIAKTTPETPKPSNSNLGLTVRIEINLPADGDQETYDRIFKSIKSNLLNG
ncbi:MAG: DUF5343 domain-containing protein [Anaerolineales bacterium]|nr:DUF5343 domain-containing protein [Anaerolineales bacterium]